MYFYFCECLQKRTKKFLGCLKKNPPEQPSVLSQQASDKRPSGVSLKRLFKVSNMPVRPTDTHGRRTAPRIPSGTRSIG